MNLDPEEAPASDDSNPLPPPDDTNPPSPSADENPPPPSDETSRFHRLHSLWQQWDRIRGLLLCMARSSGLPPTDVEIAVEEILDRIIAMTISDNPPEFPIAFAKVAMQRLLGRIRKSGCASCLSEDMKLATPLKQWGQARLPTFRRWQAHHLDPLTS